MEPVIREIDGINYQVVPFLGADCFLHFSAMVKLLGEPVANFVIAAVAKSGDKESGVLSHLSGIDSDVKVYAPAVAKALGSLASRLEPQEILLLFKAFLKNTKVAQVVNDGGAIEKEIFAPVNFDLQFHGGRMKHLHKVIFFILEVNYSDFLPDGVDLTTIVKDLAAAGAA